MSPSQQALFIWLERKLQEKDQKAGCILGEILLISEDCDTGSPKPIRSYTANGYGLYDMEGNGFEWRVLRSGSWFNYTHPFVWLTASTSIHRLPTTNTGFVAGF